MIQNLGLIFVTNMLQIYGMMIGFIKHAGSLFYLDFVNDSKKYSAKSFIDIRWNI